MQSMERAKQRRFFDSTWYFGRSVTIIGSIAAQIALLLNILLIFMVIPTR
jgi:hypothetical protein